MYCTLIALVLIYALLYIKIQNGWWFEDDPGQYAIAMHQNSPLNFFYKPYLVQGGPGHALTPFLLTSMWFDAQAAPRSVMGAYMHQLVALVLTTVLLFELVLQIFKNRALAFTFAASWLLLPSTQAVFQFISARHYLEGMLVSAASLLLLLKGMDIDDEPPPEENDRKHKLKRTVCLIGACMLLCLSVLFKEIYAAVTLPAFFMLCLWKRKYSFACVSVAIAIFYALYRNWAVGTSLNYGTPLLSFRHWLSTVSHLPYMLTGNAGGYFALLFALGAVGYGLYTKRASSLALLSFVVFITIATCSLYPISFALSYFWQAPGTFYRAPFLLNTVLWLFCVWAIFKLPRPVTILIFVCLAFPLISGCEAMRNFWTTEKTRYEREGKFYLANHDKLIYSELPAWWYLDGIGRLYDVHNRHYIAARRPDKTADASILERYHTIWRFKR